MTAKKPAAKTAAKAADKAKRAAKTKKAETVVETAENAAEKATAAQETENAAAEAPEDKASGESEQAQPWKVSRLLHVTAPLIKGEDVKAVQRALIAVGYHCGVNGANGIYGRETAHAVRCFQSSRRLIVDGKAGRFTVKALGGVWESPQEPQQTEKNR